MAFTADGHGTDLETYHPLGTSRTPPPATVKERDFLAFTTLTVWIPTDLGLWERAIRRPLWPLRLGRSQDLATARTQRVTLHSGQGAQGHALMLTQDAAAGTVMQLPTAVSSTRDRTRWDTYRYTPIGTAAAVDTGLVDDTGQALALLPPVHPAQFNTA
jgi:CRISPR-associated protein Cas5t